MYCPIQNPNTVKALNAFLKIAKYISEHDKKNTLVPAKAGDALKLGR